MRTTRLSHLTIQCHAIGRLRKSAIKIWSKAAFHLRVIDVPHALNKDAIFYTLQLS